MIKKYDKLVRDKIPEIIINSNKSCKVRKVKETELESYMYNKIAEELNEFHKAYESNKCKDMFEELVDIVTVTLAYFEECNKQRRYDDPDNCPYTLTDFNTAFDDKIEDKGGFKKGYILLEVEDNDDRFKIINYETRI